MSHPPRSAVRTACVTDAAAICFRSTSAPPIHCFGAAAAGDWRRIVVLMRQKAPMKTEATPKAGPAASRRHAAAGNESKLARYI